MADKPEDPKKPEDSKKEESLKERIGGQISQFNAEEKLDDLYSFASTHTRDTVAYIVLFAGIIISLFDAFWGGTLIGIIVGIYFSKEIVGALKSYRSVIDSLGVFRSFILGGALFGLFIASPMLFIGTAVAIGIKSMILGVENDGSSSKKGKD